MNRASVFVATFALAATSLAIASLIALSPASAAATTIHVPADQPTIQAAITAASPGDVIQVAAGNYVEQVVVNGKNVTIQGAGRAATRIQSPATLAVTFTTRQPVVTALGATDIEIRDLTVDGLGLGNGKDFVGVAYRNAGGKILDCDIVGVRDTPFSGAQEGVAVYASNTTGGPYALEVGRCNVTDWQKGGIALNSNGLTVDVHDCTVTGNGPTGVTAQNGIQLYGSNGSITNCSVSGNYWTGAVWVASGLLLWGPNTVAVTGCNLSGNQYSVYSEDASGTLNGTSITNTTVPAGFAPVALEIYNDFATTSANSARRTATAAAGRGVPPAAQPVVDADAPALVRRPNATLSNLMSFTVAGGCMTGPGTLGTQGISIYSEGAALQVGITGAEISAWELGIGTGGPGGVAVNANHNKITDNLTAGYEADGPGASTDLATLNWWGNAGGPGVGGANPVVGAGVVSSPWLTSGIDLNAGCGFTPPNLVVAGPAPSCITPAHPCITVPVNITRVDAIGIRGYSVNVQLAGNIALCTGTPASEITQDAYLSSVGSTNYHVTANGGGSYTVDCAILGATSGATAPSGVLFNLALARSGGDGTGTVTVTSVVLRDPNNAPLLSAPGVPLSVTVDYATPAAPTGLTAVQQKTGNGTGSGTTNMTLTFTPPTGTTVAVYRAPFGGTAGLPLGTYPAYTGSAPATPGYPPAAPWALTSVTTSGGQDHPATRGFWYYAAFATDACGNTSAVSNVTPGTLGYFLGDVVNPLNPVALGDDYVGDADISALGTSYGKTFGDGLYYDYLDVGPTTDYSVNSRPTPDHKIGFEDLILFAINYGGVVSAPQMAARPAAATMDAIALDVPQLPAVGETFAASVHVQGAGDVQGASVRLAYDPAVVEPVGVEAGSLLQGQGRGSIVLSPAAGGVDFALLGTGSGLAGEGEAARVLFRVKAAGTPGITLASVVARNAQNEIVTLGRLASAEGGMTPARTELGPAFPNPFVHTASLQLSLARAGAVKVAIYDLAGRRVSTLMDSVQPAGVRIVTWSGANDAGVRMAPGVYVMRLQAGGITQSRRLQFLP